VSRTVAVGLVLTLGFSSLVAQTQFPQKFEVASVKSSKIGDVGDESSRRESVESSPDGLTMRNVSLKSCIIWAYSIRDYQLFAPAWLSYERYDIFAKAVGPVPVEQMKEMLQALLSDRLGLRLHHETRELSVYVLRAGGKTPRLEVSSGSDSEMRMTDGSIVFKSTSMPQLAGHLEIIMRRQGGLPVIDKTGFQGVYNFSLKFADTNADMRAAMVQGDGAWISGILQELGLKLSSEKAGVGTIVVDHVDKVPTAN
jgi:uncharacterized protein (TIGR03435 family)